MTELETTGDQQSSPSIELDDLDAPQFVTNALQAIRQLTTFGRMVDVGFTLGSRLSHITELYRARLDGVPEAKDGIDLLDSLSKELEPYATEELAADLAYLKRIQTVQLVTILESVVEDVILKSLEHVPAVLKFEAIKTIEGPVVELLAASAGQRAEFLTAALKQRTKASLRRGVGKFEVLLEAVGLAGGVDESARRVLLELLQVRNVMVHRNGRVDRRFAENCPWLPLKEGSELRVTPKMFERYHAATMYYLVELLGRWIKRAGSDFNLSELRTVSSNALAKIRSSEESAG